MWHWKCIQHDELHYVRGTSIEVEQTDLSALWRIRFDLVEKAGGPQLPHIKRLRAASA